jgi:hypothetical protein
MAPLRRRKRTTKSTLGWSDPVSDAEAHARACGRARYNQERQFRAVIRRNLVMRRYLELDCKPGAKAQIAREFKVARSTITRDIHKWPGDQVRLCPTCFRPTLNDDWDWIVEVHKKKPHIENPFHYAAQARRDAIRAIRDELPRVLADLGVFVNEPEDKDLDAGTPHAIVLPSEMLTRMVQEISKRTPPA